MSLKILKMIDFFVVFGLCFITHFMYNWFPSTIFSIFFPVNESIFEHLKMLYSAVMIGGFFDLVILKLFKIKYNNFLINLFLTSFFSVLIFLVIYMPLFYLLGDSTFINFLVLFVSIGIGQIISYYILNAKDYEYLNYVGLIGIIFIYIIFGILTYYPFKNDLFYDFSLEKYGINTYDI